MQKEKEGREGFYFIVASRAGALACLSLILYSRLK